MSYNWPIIREKIYGILRSLSRDVMLYDAAGNETADPDDATRFFATFKSSDKDKKKFTILIAIHDEGQDSFINIKMPELPNDRDFNVVWSINLHIRSAVGQREGIKINWQVFDKAIDPREEAVNNIKESKDIGKVFGTTKSSFQRIGEAKLIIRHTETVKEDKHGARTRHLKAIFVENSAGERFAYPHLHLAGARAFARHIASGGRNHDAIAEGIINISEDYTSLKRVSHRLRKTGIQNEWIDVIRENMKRMNKKLKSLQGPKGYSAISSGLAEQMVISDQTAVDSVHNQMSNMCGCMQGDDGYDDFGKVAQYVVAFPKQEEPMSWKFRPDLNGNTDGLSTISEKLSWQLMQMSTACESQSYATRLAEIANKISNKVMPDDDDLTAIKEAFSSCYSQNVDDVVLQEEAELNEFINGFTGDAADDNIHEEDEQLRYIPGMPGEIIATTGDYVLVHDNQRYDRHTTKNEYEVYKKDGKTFVRIKNLDMPFGKPGAAIAAFNAEYNMQDNGNSDVVTEISDDASENTSKARDIFNRRLASAKATRDDILSKVSPDSEEARDARKKFKDRLNQINDAYHTMVKKGVVTNKDDAEVKLNESVILERIKNLAGI